MGKRVRASTSDKTLDDFLQGKSAHTVSLFHHFVSEFLKIGAVTIHPAKTMIGIATTRKRIVYITQLGKDFVHVVFPFDHPYTDNLCFQKIANVPGDIQQNHHLRIYRKEDVNAEVKKFMRLAFSLGN
jgi:hypothetical protein